ncbi:hypothetical protein VPNG_01492 [Cytospora leucostoma]|uniref:N-acetyltransferase domain-containing protein n=1 Tax=Cytospora leucostoma TaxID=1230097 RepID=A0A423XK68_9PEZI|nr:hypothetical protein VPNG_01492 [Cytospora leucostoma]
MSSPDFSFSLVPVISDDISILSEICGLAFENDRHTMLKAAHPTEPYDHGSGMAGAFEYWLSLPPNRLQVTKAVDNQTGDVLGVVAWGLRLDQPDLQPARHEETQGSPAAGGNDTTSQGSAKKPVICISKDYAKTSPPDMDPLAQLEQITSSHLADYQKRVMPEGTRCMYVVSITVHPKHQGRGVGSALVRKGTQRADAEGVLCWVHSSEHAAPLFRKCGFEVDDILELDLDAWAGKMDLKPLAGDDKRGTYTFRYMVRQPEAV